MKINDLTDHERQCLVALYHSTYPDELCVPFSVIENDARLDRKTVRASVRSLADKGLARFYLGLMDEDGKLRGSGYCTTNAGHRLAEDFEYPPETSPECDT